MKITKISFSFSLQTSDRSTLYASSKHDETIAALVSALHPFISTAKGVDLAYQMIDWVNTKEWSAQAAEKIIQTIRSSNMSQQVSVEFATLEVNLRMLFDSGTQIRLLGEPTRSAWKYTVEVNFGPNTLYIQALQILYTAENKGIIFEAYNGEEQIGRYSRLHCDLADYAAGKWLEKFY